MDRQQLKATLSSGLLSFPVTDFDAARRLPPRELCAAARMAGALRRERAVRGGRHRRVLLARAERVLRRSCAPRSRPAAAGSPIMAGVGCAHATAIAFAREAERLGAAGLLLLPHYLTEAPQEGLAAHVEAVCRAVADRRHRLQPRRLPPERRDRSRGWPSAARTSSASRTASATSS